MISLQSFPLQVMYIAKFEIQGSHLLRIKITTTFGHVAPCSWVDGANIMQQPLQGKGNTDMRHLTMVIRYEKCVVRRFCRHANVYLYKPRLYSKAYYTPRLYGIACCS